MVQSCFFSHGASFELLETLCSFCPGTKDLMVLEAMPNDSCLLDLKDAFSSEKQLGSSKIQVSLGMSAPSAFRGVVGEHVPGGVCGGQSQLLSRFTFLLTPSSKDKSPTLQMPSHKLSWGEERVAPGKFPLLLQKTCFSSLRCYSQKHIVLHGQKFLWQQTKQ